MKYRHLHGYKYESLETETVITEIVGMEIDMRYITLWESGQLFIRERYAWDGASGPTWDDKTNMRGSLVHDALYQLMREGHLDRIYRRYADELLREICLADGMWKFRADVWFWFVRKFGEKYSMPQKKPPMPWWTVS